MSTTRPHPGVHAQKSIIPGKGFAYSITLRLSSTRPGGQLPVWQARGDEGDGPRASFRHTLSGGSLPCLQLEAQGNGSCWNLLVSASLEMAKRACVLARRGLLLEVIAHICTGRTQTSDQTLQAFLPWTNPWFGGSQPIAPKSADILYD